MADEQETHWEENNSDDPAEELTEEQLNSWYTLFNSIVL
jgi:hypothetical protein